MMKILFKKSRQNSPRQSVGINSMFIIISLSFVVLLSMVNSANATSVKIVTGERGYYLLLDGAPFYIKGLGCGEDVGVLGNDYLKMAKEAGANAVRTWGTNQGDKNYLDAAAKYGLKVAAGIWLNYVDDDGAYSYLSDEKYLANKKKEIIEYVKTFKDHPAILMWNVGNEAIVFTKNEKEKIALCRFLNEICATIHDLDPDHPIIYAGAGTTHFKYLKKYVPNIDIIGVNCYCSVRFIQVDWENLNWHKPYVLTELGARLPQDTGKDKNRLPRELSDQAKAIFYREHIDQMFDFQGSNLGGFVFHLGETTQESMTWWNVNEYSDKRLAYWIIHRAYTKEPIKNYPPEIKSFVLSEYRHVRPGQVINAEVLTEDTEQEALYYRYAISTAIGGVLKYYVNNYLGTVVYGAGPCVKIKSPAEKGNYRVYVFVYDQSGNVTSMNHSITIADD
ncbi:MAG: glycoside hydrolase family 2 TIM barrel-domain containing protein [Candidatus Omnitrophota bacterium]